MNATQILDDIIRREGGFVDHPADRGGPTKYGITQRTLSEWLKREATREDVESLTEPAARSIYFDLYLREPRFNQIEDERLRALVVDSGVNHGVRRAAKWLQRAAGVADDGIVGPRTLAAVNGSDSAALYRKVLAQRAIFYGKIITNDPSQAVFAHGWMRRLAEFIDG